MWFAKRRLLRIWKTAQAIVAQVVFGFPGRKLRAIGVTGTDGKTTTVHFVVKALESAGYTVGAISTIHFQVGTRVWTNASKLTTPGPWQLAKLLAHMVRAGCHYVVIECSSHRLDQGGLWGIPFDVAVITNITREHFDYHRNFDDYAHAKRRLFRALHHPAKMLPFRRGIDPGGRAPTVAVANLDDERCAVMLSEPAERVFGFTLNPNQLPKLNGETSEVGIPRHAQSVIARTVGDSQFAVVRTGGYEALTALKLPGRFNLANALAAIAVGVSQGIDLARITRELSEVECIPGRMDRVGGGQPFTVIVDYAVTPAAFEALYAEISKFRAPNSKQAPSSNPKIIHVFGAAGGRDRGKRPLLGEIAGRRADLVILTDEDPYGEDSEQILNDLEAGVVVAGMRKEDKSEGYSGTSKVFLRIRDRRSAIREALQRAQSGDVVLITGKGAEETMAIGSQRILWNDRRVIEEELRSKGI